MDLEARLKWSQWRGESSRVFWDLCICRGSFQSWCNSVWVTFFLHLGVYCPGVVLGTVMCGVVLVNSKVRLLISCFVEGYHCQCTSANQKAPMNRMEAESIWKVEPQLCLSGCFLEEMMSILGKCLGGCSRFGQKILDWGTHFPTASACPQLRRNRQLKHQT